MLFKSEVVQELTVIKGVVRTQADGYLSIKKIGGNYSNKSKNLLKTKTNGTAERMTMLPYTN